MAETLTTGLNMWISAALSQTDALGNVASFLINQPALSLQLTSGTGANKANLAMALQRTLGVAASDSISMYNFQVNGTGPTGVDGLGNAVVFATIKIFILQNLSTTPTDYLSIGNDNTSAAWTSLLADKTDIIKVRGGGIFMAMAPDATGYAVANTTNHLLKILNSGAGSVTYNLLVIGATA